MRIGHRDYEEVEIPVWRLDLSGSPPIIPNARSKEVLQPPSEPWIFLKPNFLPRKFLVATLRTYIPEDHSQCQQCHMGAGITFWIGHTPGFKIKSISTERGHPLHFHEGDRTTDNPDHLYEMYGAVWSLDESRMVLLKARGQEELMALSHSIGYVLPCKRSAKVEENSKSLPVMFDNIDP